MGIRWQGGGKRKILGCTHGSDNGEREGKRKTQLCKTLNKALHQPKGQEEEEDKAAQVNKKFTTIFFIHLKCYANTHEVFRGESRRGERLREREGERVKERGKCIYIESNICGT